MVIHEAFFLFMNQDNIISFEFTVSVKYKK
jgi:hypothetical protein